MTAVFSAGAGGRAPGQAAELGADGGGRGRPEVTGPAAEQGVVVDEELPVGENRVAHEEERHRRLERTEARVVQGGPLVAVVEEPEEDPVLLVGLLRELLQDGVEERSCALGPEIGNATMIVL